MPQAIPALLDLSTCDQEPIRTPASIQPHGFLLTLGPKREVLQASASGLLAVPISRIHKHYLLWFRPEQVYTVEWAGNPQSQRYVRPT